MSRPATSLRREIRAILVVLAVTLAASLAMARACAGDRASRAGSPAETGPLSLPASKARG